MPYSPHASPHASPHLLAALGGVLPALTMLPGSAENGVVKHDVHQIPLQAYNGDGMNSDALKPGKAAPDSFQPEALNGLLKDEAIIAAGIGSGPGSMESKCTSGAQSYTNGQGAWLMTAPPAPPPCSDDWSS